MVRTRPPYRITTAQYAAGIVVTIGLYLHGFMWAIPTLGRIGWFYLAWITVIFAINTYGYLRSRNR